MSMGFCFRKFPILACSLSLFISSGVSFANPGDYLVSRLDVEKDKNLKCCCCGCNLLDNSTVNYRSNPPVFYIKYNEGDNIKDAITSARKFNTDKKPEDLRATLFKKIEDIIAKVRVNNPKAISKRLGSKGVSDLTTKREVAEAFRNFIENLNGLFCIGCIIDSMYMLGINTFHEFLSFEPSRKYSENCTVCFGKIFPYVGAKFCDVCNYCYLCNGCKSGWSTCSVCKIGLENNCYLFNKVIHRYSDRANGRFEVYLNQGIGYCKRMELEENGRQFVIEYNLEEGNCGFVIKSYVFNDSNSKTHVVFSPRWKEDINLLQA